MTYPAPLRYAGHVAVCCLVLILVAASAQASPGGSDAGRSLVAFLNMNEGSGQYAIDFSGNGNSGEIHNVARIKAGACGNALFFNGIDSYAAIPYRSSNHPVKEITIDLWFSVDSYDRQVLVSTYYDGGYRIAFDDGNDLWWTVSTGRGDVSVPIQHESITLHRWHHLAGTYDGKTSKLYLDGVLRNVANGTGGISYTVMNDVLLGADAGPSNLPNPSCNGYLRGGLDEVRIYDRALTYGQVMDDRFSCPQEPVVPEFTPFDRNQPASCNGMSATLPLSGDGPVTHRITINSADESAVLNLEMPPGSVLYAGVKDAYGASYPDSWYFEINEDGKRLARSVSFPNRINTPAESIVRSGNATIVVKYYDGLNRFPSSAYITFDVIVPQKPVVQPLPPSPPLFSNPIIVIYTASWATLIAVILVFYWLRSRNKRKSEEAEKKE